MSDMSHTLRITADLSKARQIANGMRSNAPSATEVEADPKAFLHKFGVEVDDETASLIKRRLSKRLASSVQAAVIHLDT